MAGREREATQMPLFRIKTKCQWGRWNVSRNEETGRSSNTNQSNKQCSGLEDKYYKMQGRKGCILLHTIQRVTTVSSARKLTRFSPVVAEVAFEDKAMKVSDLSSGS